MKRKRYRCEGCGGWTDGRHLDRALLAAQVESAEAMVREAGRLLDRLGRKTGITMGAGPKEEKDG